VPPQPLRVAYAPVVARVPHLLPTADLVLHIGLAAERPFFTVERQAPRGPYDKYKDVDGHTFSDAEAKRLFGGCPRSLQPTIDCDDVWKRWRKEVKDESADIRTGSHSSVGNYLCGFVYFLSLSWFWKRKAEERPVLFLHVPDLPTKADIAQGREVAIGLIRAMVASRKAKGIFDPLEPSLLSVFDVEVDNAALFEDTLYQNQ
jgi:pyroglutamyl-peptidase